MRFRFCSIVLLGCLATAALAVHAPEATIPDYPSIRTNAQQTMSPLPPEASPVLSVLKNLTGSDWSGYARADGITAWRIFGTGLRTENFPANAGDAFRIAEAILPEVIKSVYGVPIEMERLSANQGGARWYIEFRQVINGIPVDGATIALRITDKRFIPLIQLGVVDPRRAGIFNGIGESSAQTIAATITNGTVEKIEAVWLLRDGSFATGPALQACYVVTTDVASDNKPVIYLDAATGALVGGWNRVNFDWATSRVTGGIHPMYRNDSLRYMPMEYDTVKLDNTRLMANTAGYARNNFSFTTPYLDTASAYLRGRYADVRPYSTRNPRAHPRTSGVDTVYIRFDSSNSRQSEPNMFYHLNVVHDWFKALDPRYAGPDYMVPGLVDRGGYANAYWDGNGTNFGDGGGSYDNFSMYSDVIYHEFTHGVTQYQYTGYSLPYSGQSGAMNEGWSDYFACTINGDSHMGEGGLMLSSGAMRELVNTLRYPSPDTEVHDYSRCFSGSLWDIRTLIGAPIADTLFHFSKYAHATTFFDYFVDVLEHDDNDGNLTNGTPHSTNIYWGFGDRHGIGPGSMPNLVISNMIQVMDGSGGSSGNGDRYFDYNETMVMTLKVKNDVLMYPPPATGITLTFQCDDPALITPAVRSIQNMNPRDSIVVSGLYFYNNTSTSRWVNVRYTLAADRGYSKTDSFRILLGHPQLLVMWQDTSIYTVKYVTKWLDSMHVGYYTVAFGSGVNPATIMPDHNELIWVGGHAQTIVGATDAAALVTYLNRGGKLLISGENLRAITSYPALQSLLHFTILNDSILGRRIYRAPYLQLAAPMLYLFGGEEPQSVADDMIQPTTGAFPLYTFEGVADSIVAIAYGNDANINQYRVVVCGFGIETIHKPSVSYYFPDMLQPILNWFEGTLATPEPHAEVPVVFAMRAYPNPFNSELRVSVSLPQSGALSLALVDVLGRTVWSQTQPATAGNHTAIINGRHLTSGLYFLKVDAPGNHTAMKKVTYLK